MSSFSSRQAGVALLTALLITAIATVAAVAMASRQQLDIRRTSNVLDVDRAYMFALGVEEWAKQILARDREDNQTDHLEEDWATILPPLTVEGAVVAGRIDDLQGRFNLNNLVKEGKPSEIDRQRFQRLLREREIEDTVIQSVIDWIDSDEDTTFPDGAEDGEYLSFDIPYRTANRLMASPSELLLVKGMTYEDYLTIASEITALPGRTPVNVNTASVEVLMGLVEGLTEADAELIIEEKGEDGFESVEQFINLPMVQNAKLTPDELSVSSDYFMITTMAEFDRGLIQLFSLVKRAQNGNVQLVMRAQGVY